MKVNWEDLPLGTVFGMFVGPNRYMKVGFKHKSRIGALVLYANDPGLIGEILYLSTTHEIEVFGNVIGVEEHEI